MAAYEGTGLEAGGVRESCEGCGVGVVASSSWVAGSGVATGVVSACATGAAVEGPAIVSLELVDSEEESPAEEDGRGGSSIAAVVSSGCGWVEVRDQLLPAHCRPALCAMQTQAPRPRPRSTRRCGNSPARSDDLVTFPAPSPAVLVHYSVPLDPHDAPATVVDISSLSSPLVEDPGPRTSASEQARDRADRETHRCCRCGLLVQPLLPCEVVRRVVRMLEDGGKREGEKRRRGRVCGLLPAQSKVWKRMQPSNKPRSGCRACGRGQEAKLLSFGEHDGDEVIFREDQEARQCVSSVMQQEYPRVVQGGCRNLTLLLTPMRAT